MTTSLVAKAALAAAATMITLTPALADWVDKRQNNQAHRIEQGMRSGQLSKHEATTLNAEQKRIAATERRFERDGRLTRGERAYLDGQQDRASRHIYAEKHDGQWGWNRQAWRPDGYRSWYPHRFDWSYSYNPYRRWW